LKAVAAMPFFSTAAMLRSNFSSPQRVVVIADFGDDAGCQDLHLDPQFTQFRAPG
jgi:hypothetical protein